MLNSQKNAANVASLKMTGTWDDIAVSIKVDEVEVKMSYGQLLGLSDAIDYAMSIGAVRTIDGDPIDFTDLCER